MVAQVVGDEARNEKIAMIVAGVTAQRQRLTGCLSSRFKVIEQQLFGQKFIGQALVDQQRWEPAAGFDQGRGVMLRPCAAVIAQVYVSARIEPHLIEINALRFGNVEQARTDGRGAVSIGRVHPMLSS